MLLILDISLLTLVLSCLIDLFLCRTYSFLLTAVPSALSLFSTHISRLHSLLYKCGSSPNNLEHIVLMQN